MATVATQSDQVKSMKDKPVEQGLAKAQPITVGTVLSTPDQFRAYLAEAKRAGAHILSPVTDIGAMPENWVFVPSAVYLDPDPIKGDVYQDGFVARGEDVAPAKVGLRKIAKGAGISWKVSREDSGTVEHYWAMKCEISYRGHDGLIKTEEASYEWDLRDSSERLNLGQNGMSKKELTRARVNGYRRCEAGAINAAIREYGVKQKYTKKELAFPFIVFNLVFIPQTEDQKNMLAQAALTGTNMLYGGTVAALPPVSHAKGEIVDQFTGAETSKVSDFTDDEPAGDETKPVKVMHVGQNESQTDFYVTVEGGLILHTKDRGVAKTCAAAMKAGTPIVIETEGNEILELGGGRY